uniref:Putative DNA repair exonuclease SbcCD D subunit n=1 Tax=Erythrocytic necrosis virus TaxID=1543320 RepID=A0A4D6QJ90_9VIRU|nr:putative DNA repair exonuclease SbcCD D subunit [Erythrocytic necrosis virus]
MPVFYVVDSKANIKKVKSLDEIQSPKLYIFRQNIRWKRFSWKGPYKPEFAENEANRFPSGLSELLYMFREQNMLKPFTRESIKTFEKHCLDNFGTRINTKNLPANLGLWVSPPPKHQTAIIDGQQVAVKNWQLPGPSIAINGIPIPGVGLSKVEINKSDPGSFWLAKWIHKNKVSFTTIQEPFFEDVSHLGYKRKDYNMTVNTFGKLKTTEDISDDEPSYSSESEEEVDYDSDSEDELDSEDVDDTDSDSEDVEYDSDEDESIINEITEDESDSTPLQPSDSFGRIHKTTETNSLDFALFSQHEQILLPIGYMVPRNVEWQYVMTALKSNFTKVDNLIKVRDYTLREFYIILGSFAIKSK